MNTTIQPTLFDLPPLERVQFDAGMTPRERFEAFHAQNPQVYDALRSVSVDAKRSGFIQWGIKAALEVVRWHYAIQTHGDAFRVNNNFAPYYARVLMEREPALDGFFETRVQPSELRHDAI